MLLCIQLAIIIAGHRISNSLNDIAWELKEMNRKQKEKNNGVDESTLWRK